MYYAYITFIIMFYKFINSMSAHLNDRYYT
ncbi:hypothetical protein V12B01_13050 [Vibrio splendidus 12B01]|nr:hypothetical protein V12B01_13050 [Vibrio splendidus 12B01]